MSGKMIVRLVALTTVVFLTASFSSAVVAQEPAYCGKLSVFLVMPMGERVCVPLTFQEYIALGDPRTAPIYSTVCGYDRILVRVPDGFVCKDRHLNGWGLWRRH